MAERVAQAAASADGHKGGEEKKWCLQLVNSLYKSKIIKLPHFFLVEIK